MTSLPYIALADCQHRGLYRIHCRNLTLGVFDDEKKGFIGIREKFESRYLFMEYHYDVGAPHGTVKPVAYLNEDLPSSIELVERLKPSVDRETGRPVAFDKPISDGGRGWYFLDTNEADQNIKSVAVMNDALFDWLEART